MSKARKVRGLIKRSGRRGIFALFWTLFLLALFWYDSRYGLIDGVSLFESPPRIHARGLSGGSADSAGRIAGTRRTASGKPSAVPVKSAGTVRICTFNVKNYTATDRYVDGVWRSRYPKPASEKRAIRNILLDIDADILLLQEIGSEIYMDELLDSLAAEGLEYLYYVVASGTDPDRRLAIASKMEISQIYSSGDIVFAIGAELKSSPRGVLLARFEYPNLPGKFWFAGTLHLKSKFGAKKADGLFNAFRSAELSTLLGFARRKAGANPALLAGDFNDEPFEEHIFNVLKRENFSYIVQSDYRGRAYSYHWKRRSVNYIYDFFIANPQAKLLMSAPRVYGVDASASDHSAVYVDLKFPGADVAASN